MFRCGISSNPILYRINGMGMGRNKEWMETKGKIISDYNDKIDSILKIKKLSNEYV